MNVKQEPAQKTSAADDSPYWNLIYLIVIVHTAVVILLLWWFSEAFS